MSKLKITFISSCILVLLLCRLDTTGQQIKNDSINKASNKSNLNLELPLWIPGFKGSFSYGNITIDGEGQSGDILSKLFSSDLSLEFFFVGEIGYNVGSWVFQADIFGGQLHDAITFTYTNTNVADVKILMIMPRAYAGYVFLDKSLSQSRKSLLKGWIYFGIRDYHVNIKSDATSDFVELDFNRSWVDPIIGYTIPYQLNKWTFLIQNDFGGFGIGSDFSWFLQLQGIYHVGDHVSIEAGWVIQDMDYSKKTNFDQFDYNVRLSGPMAGISFHF